MFATTISWWRQNAPRTLVQCCQHSRSIEARTEQILDLYSSKLVISLSLIMTTKGEVTQITTGRVISICGSPGSPRSLVTMDAMFSTSFSLGLLADVSCMAAIISIWCNSAYTFWCVPFILNHFAGSAFLYTSLYKASQSLLSSCCITRRFSAKLRSSIFVSLNALGC